MLRATAGLANALRGFARFALLLPVALCAASCATAPASPDGQPALTLAENPPAPPTDVDFAALGSSAPPSATPLRATLSNAPDDSDESMPPELTKAEIYPAVGAQIAPAGMTGATSASGDVLSGSDGVTLNFANTDVHQVIDIVLGETLHLNYSIDPKVKGLITARTARPLPRDAVLATLENVLAMNDIAIVQQDGVYQVVPMSETGKAIPSPEPLGAELGYGVHILPMRYVSARQVVSLMQPYMPPGRTIQVLEGKNVILFTGTSSEARQIEELAETFDVDWLRGHTFALLPVTYADATTITDELAQLFGVQPNGPLNGVIGFMPITRLNAVLAMSTQPSYIDEAKTWVQRLDRQAVGSGRTTYVYKVQNARARDLAKVLESLYGNTSAASNEPAPVAPNAQPMVFSQPAGEGITSATDASNSSNSSGSAGGSDQQATQDPTASNPAPTSFETKDGIRVVADDTQNAILVSCNREQYEEVSSVLRQLDTVPLQVLIEATIAEVTLNDELKYGLQWYFHTGQGLTTLSNATDGSVNPNFPDFSYVLNMHNASVVLDALSKITKVRVISSPTLLVLDNQRATLQVGDEVPVAVSSSQSTTDSGAPIVNEIEFRDTGVILDVTPRVNSNGLVLLDISQEVSDVVSTTTSNLDSPTVRQRKLASAIAVNSGETVALGGLIQDNTTKDHSGVPLLSEIPVLGNAFKTTDNTHTRTELLVLITPRIARDMSETRALTDELRSRLGSLAPLQKRIDDPRALDNTGVLGRLRDPNY